MHIRLARHAVILLAGMLLLTACNARSTFEFRAEASDNAHAQLTRVEGTTRVIVCPNSEVQLHWFIPADRKILLDEVNITKCVPANPDGTCTENTTSIYNTARPKAGVACPNITNTSHTGCVVDTPTENTRYQMTYSEEVGEKVFPGLFSSQAVESRSEKECL